MKLISVLIIVLSAVAFARINPIAVHWSEQAIGKYNKGKLVHATALPFEGPGLVKIVRPRLRHWGTREAVRMLELTAEQLHEFQPEGERLQVADLSAKHGGKITRHGSHQNGLDIDLIYFRNDHKEQDPKYTKGLIENFVVDGRLTRNFDIRRNWELMKALHRHGKVTRIFVDQKIKDVLCNEARRLNEFYTHEEVLRSLRPWPNHADHLHVRLACPTNSPRCINQNPPPTGSGCL